ncbi:hypothetical protein, partial [Campylobacter coli]
GVAIRMAVLKKLILES